MISYLGKTKLKTMFVKEIENHRKLDMIIQGTYGQENGTWKGCAVGCSIHSLNIKLKKNYSTSDHSVYEKELGIPEWLARLEDIIFEGLSVEESKKWPEQFAKAIPVGVNLEPVKWKFCAFILKENIELVLTLKISDELKKQVVDSIRGVLRLNESAIKTGIWDDSAAESAARSAESAARSAAWSAESAAESAESAARSAAWSAESAARSARSAAWSAAWSAESAARSAESAAWSAESAARSAAYTKYAKELLRLIKLQK
jgi:hypothetical protein